MDNKETIVKEMFAEYKKEKQKSLDEIGADIFNYNLIDDVEKCAFSDNVEDGYLMIEKFSALKKRADENKTSTTFFSFNDLAYYALAAAFVNGIYNDDITLIEESYTALSNLSTFEFNSFWNTNGEIITETSINIGDINEEIIHYMNDSQNKIKIMPWIIKASIGSDNERAREYVADYFAKEGGIISHMPFHMPYKYSYVTSRGLLTALLKMLEQGKTVDEIQYEFNNDILLQTFDSSEWDVQAVVGALMYGRIDVAEWFSGEYLTSRQKEVDFKLGVLRYFYPVTLINSPHDISNVIGYFEKAGINKESIEKIYGSYENYSHFYGYSTIDKSPEIIAGRICDMKIMTPFEIELYDEKYLDMFKNRNKEDLSI